MAKPSRSKPEQKGSASPAQPEPNLAALRRELEELRVLVAAYRAGEAGVRDTEQRLRAVVDNAPVILFALDAEGRFTLSEGRGLEPLGLKPGQVVGQSAFELYKDTPQVIGNLSRCFAGEPVNEVVNVEGAVFEALYTPRRDAEGKVVGLDGLAWDITRRARAEDTARGLQTQLLQAQKIETIGTLAGGIAHDFNNILSPILGYTDIALDQLEENHPARDDLRQVLNAAERARELVQQILIFARGGEQERYPVQLHLVVQEVLKLIRASLPTTVEISQRVDARNDVVMADAGQMHQVIMNLCTNAAYAMRANGGVMRIELERREITPANVSSHPTITPGHYVVLTVQDHGVGMPAEVRSRVFEPFFTTKPSGEGTGLGLSVVHGIVHSHGGAVLVDSKPGAGSTFSVYLPAVADTRHNSEAENNAGAMGRGEHVLVVDDEPEIARMLRRMLESKGFRVTAFVSGDLALDAFRKAPGDFDAVLTDQTMPRMTGLVLARAVGSLRPDIPVILATGYSKKRPGEENWPENLEVVTKPFDATTLTALLRRLLDAGRPSGT